MGKSLLMRLIGYPALLIHGDTMVWDRWRWLKRRLPRTRNDERLLDCGCGTGAFTIGAAKRGYQATGITSDDQAVARARERAGYLTPGGAVFDSWDIRKLAERADFQGVFEIAICLEVIEHLGDDRALMRNLAACLKPGGRLLLTTPYYHYIAITRDEEGPRIENDEDAGGGHVRRGYSIGMLGELCDDAGLVLEEVSYCSGILSQRLTALMRVLTRLHYLIAWAAVLPLRLLPPVFDGIVTRLVGWRYYSICIEAYKPRFEEPAPTREQ